MKTRVSILRRTLSILLLLIFSAPLALVLLAVQQEASLSPGTALSPLELNRIENLILESAPDTTAYTSETVISLTAEDLNLLLRYSAQIGRSGRALTAETTLADSQLRIDYSYQPLPGVTLFINGNAQFNALDNGLQLQEIRLGNLRVPRRLLRWTGERLRQRFTEPDTVVADLNEVIGNVQSVEISDDRLQLNMLWDPQLIGRIGERTQQLMMSEADKTRVIVYYEFIATLIDATPLDRRALSLNSVMVPLFQLALERSIDNDPIEENRALLIALATYVGNLDLGTVVGSAASEEALTPSRFIEVRLLRREDLARHLTAMAALSTRTNEGIAAMLSTTKEAYDARYRSGFSFSDIAANSVGTRLAQAATSSPESARALQQRMNQIESETDYMPTIGNSLDGLSEAEFREQFEDRLSAAYQEQLEEIEQRIDQLPVFQDLARRL